MGRSQKLKLAKKAEPVLLKLDLGCGKNVREGFEGVDSRDFGQPHKVNLAWRDPHVPGVLIDPYTNKDAKVLPNGFVSWPWPDASVEEAHTSHFVEHLTAPERIHFVNELYRVLVPGAKCLMITPHWASCRAYGDLTHQWPPVSEFWFYYLSKAWREQNAPHNDAYTCDFEVTWGYALHQLIAPRNMEYQQHALQFWKEAAQDINASLTARK